MDMMEDTLQRKRECWPAGYPGMGKTEADWLSDGLCWKLS